MNRHQMQQTKVKLRYSTRLNDQSAFNIHDILPKRYRTTHDYAYYTIVWITPSTSCTGTSPCLLCGVIQRAYYHHHYAACRVTAVVTPYVPTCPEGPREKEPDLTLHTYSWPVEEQHLFQVLVLYYSRAIGTVLSNATAAFTWPET